MKDEIIPGESAVNLQQPGGFCCAAAEVELLMVGSLAAMNDCAATPLSPLLKVSEGI